MPFLPRRPQRPTDILGNLAALGGAVGTRVGAPSAVSSPEPEPMADNLFLPRGGFFGRHPKLSRGIENALLMASQLGEPADTTAGNVAQVAQAFLGLGPAREAIRTEREMAPLKRLMPMLGLEKAAAEIDLARSHAQYYRQQGEADLLKARQLKGADMWEGVHVDPVSGEYKGINKFTGKVEVIPGAKLGIRPQRDPTGTEMERRLDAMLGQDSDPAAREQLRARLVASDAQIKASAAASAVLSAQFQAGVKSTQAAQEHRNTQRRFLQQELRTLEAAGKAMNPSLRALMFPKYAGWDDNSFKAYQKSIERAYQTIDQALDIDPTITAEQHVDNIRRGVKLPPKPGAAPTAPDVGGLTPLQRALIDAISNQ